MNKFIKISSSILLLSNLAVFNAFAHKQITFCLEGSPEGFDPALYQSGTTFTVTSVVYDKLMDFIPGTTKVTKQLADSYSFSEDKKEITFKIHKGVKFHSNKYFKPSRELNADDVIFSLKRQGDDKNPWHNLKGKSYQYWEDMGMNKIIKNIEKIDDYTVKISLTEPNAPIMANFAMEFLPIVSKEYADTLLKMNKKYLFNSMPIGSGPFIFKGYKKDSSIRYMKNNAYWDKKGLTNADRMIIEIVPDASVRYSKMLANECQAVAYPNYTDVPSMKKNKNINVKLSSSASVGYLAFNLNKKKFQDVRVRKALAYATNRKQIIKAIFKNNAVIANSPIPKALWGSYQNPSPISFDLKKAKKLLSEAGYNKDHPLTLDLWAMPVSRPYNPNARRMAEIIQQDWKKIGVKVKIVSYEWGEYIRRTRNKEEDMYMLGWSTDNGDPDNFIGTLLTCEAAKNGQNTYCSKDFDKYVIKARKTYDKEARIDLYKKAQEVYFKDQPWITIAYPQLVTANTNKISNYYPPVTIPLLDKIQVK